MHLHSLLPITAIYTLTLPASTLANFIIVTDGPVPEPTPPPSITDAEAQSSWLLSVASSYEARLDSWAIAQGTSFANAFISALEAIDEFAATATYSVPSAAGALTTATMYTTVPEWYTALPEDVKKQKEIEASAEINIWREVVADANSSAAPSDRGGLVWGFAAGAVALAVVVAVL